MARHIKVEEKKRALEQLDPHLRALLARPDRVAQLKIQQTLREWFHADLAWFYEQLKIHVMFGGPNTTAGTQLLGRIFERLLPEVRELVNDDPGVGLKPVAIKIYNVNRGTKESRERMRMRPIPTTATRVPAAGHGKRTRVPAA